MANDALATYLNDHLAGSVMALELLERLTDDTDDTALAQTIDGVRSSIATDRQELEALMERLEIGVSGSRQAAAWFTEKLTTLKLRLDDPDHGALRRLESLEAVALGILGKQALWHALASTAPAIPELRELDFVTLLQRGSEQHETVEPLRVQAAREAFLAGQENMSNS